MIKRLLALLLFPLVLLAQAPKVTVTTRSGSSAPLTYSQVDANFTGLQRAVNASQRAWGNNEATTTGLTFGYYGGPAWNGSAWVDVADGTVVLTGSATNYVVRTVAGVVTANTTGWTFGTIPMAKVVTTTSISSILDFRNSTTVPFLHTYAESGTNGSNLFLGPNAGNYTMSKGGGAASLASTNIGVGESALNSLTTGYENTAIGKYSMWKTTTGNRSTAVGLNTLTANIDGHHCIAFGQNALLSNTSGTYNTALGIDALHDNTTGYYNVAVGQNALLTCIDGFNNTAIGIDALKVLTSGRDNTVVGQTAGYAITSGFYNTALGQGALHGCTNHVANTAIGQWAGYTNDANYSVFLGYQAGYFETAGNKLFIDNQQRASEADARLKALIYGIFDAATANQWLYVNGNLLVREYLNQSAGSVVASATTITPTGQIFHVSGTTAIATINLPNTGFKGSITLIPDAAFTTTTAGNIGLASTAVIGRALIMTYDGTKWYPSY